MDVVAVGNPKWSSPGTPKQARLGARPGGYSLSVSPLPLHDSFDTPLLISTLTLLTEIEPATVSVIATTMTIKWDMIR